MTTPKGYPSQLKEDRTEPQFCSIQPVTPERYALEVTAMTTAFEVATDTVDSATTTVITAAAHSALRGDIIKITSGTLANRFFTVWETDTNTITLGQDTGTAAAAGVAFQILRPCPEIVSSGGATVVTAAVANATFAADAAIAGASLTNSYAALVTTAGPARSFSVRNTTDTEVMVSLNGGTTTHFYLDPGEAITYDLAAAGRVLASGSAVQARYNTATTAVGKIKFSYFY